MTVIILERVPRKLKGELTRWMLEVGDGIFVNRLSATVRTYLWELICRVSRPRTGAILIYASAADQGFTILYHGKPTQEIVDFEGLALVRLPTTSQKRKGEPMRARPGPRRQPSWSRSEW